MGHPVIRTLFALVTMMPAVSAIHATQLDLAACNAVLAKDYYQFALRDNLEIYYLEYLDKETFESNRDAFAKTGFVVIQEIPYQDKMSYERLKEERAKYFTEHRYHFSHQEAVDIVQRVTAERAYTSWDKCVELAVHADQTGIIVRPERESPEVIDIRVKYVNTFVNPKGVRLLVTLTGGVVESAPNGRPWSAHSDFWNVNEDKHIRIFRTRGTTETTINITAADGTPADSSLAFQHTYTRADATIRVDFTRTVERRAPKGEDSASTNSDQKYDGGNHTLTLNAAPGYVLKNPAASCNESASGPECQHTGHDTPKLSPDGKTATVGFAVNGGSAAIFLHAEQWESKDCGGPVVIPIIIGQTQSIPIPTECLAVSRITVAHLTGKRSVVPFPINWEWSPDGSVHRLQGIDGPNSPTTELAYTLTK